MISRNKASKKSVKKMCDLMKHRGPDDEGFHANGKACLGMRRLSIIDLEGGHQPIYSDDKSKVIVFNGEIYNYKELRKKLEKKHSFKTETDTEVVLKLYEEKGEACLKDLRGMFAFAVWDSEKEKLFIARDRVGEKPLCYALVDGEFYFASEVQALIKSAPLKREVNPEALVYYFLHNLKHVPDPLSIFKGVHKLPPASHLTLENGRVKIEKYWTPSFKNKVKDEGNAVRELRELLRESVREQELASDVPVGAMLSGGVDSSAVVASLSNPAKTNTYSISADKDDPEYKRALTVSAKFNTNHKNFFFEGNQLNSLIDLIKNYGEPLNLLSAIYSQKLSREISKELKVVLNGNGADELFYGYDGSNSLLLASKAYNLTDKLRASTLLGRIASVFDWVLPERAKLFFKLMRAHPDKRKGELYRYSFEKNQDLFSKQALNSVDGVDFGRLVDEKFKECDSTHYIEKAYYSGLFLENAHSVTIIGDLTGMSNSLEIRSPFLDPRIIEFSARLPPEMKCKSVFDKKFNKYALKKAMEGELPDEILYAKKMGFGYSIDWKTALRTTWKKEVESYLFNGVLEKTNLFNMTTVKEKFKAHIEGKENNADLLWGLIAFTAWYEIFILEREPSFKIK